MTASLGSGMSSIQNDSHSRPLMNERTYQGMSYTMQQRGLQPQRPRDHRPKVQLTQQLRRPVATIQFGDVRCPLLSDL